MDAQREHPELETLPYAWNAGAGYRITPRAIAKTDPDILAANGEGIYFPLPFSPLACKDGIAWHKNIVDYCVVLIAWFSGESV